MYGKSLRNGDIKSLSMTFSGRVLTYRKEYHFDYDGMLFDRILRKLLQKNI